VIGVDHPGQDTGLFEKGVSAFPVDAGTFHHHELYAQRHQPIYHCSLVALKTAELALRFRDSAVVVFHQDRHCVDHPVHIDARSHLLKSMKRFHEKLPSVH
jgi:hypothetical protein